METNIKYAVIGGGSWATAIVKMLTTNESKVGWYMRSVYAKEHLLNAKHNPNYLSSVDLTQISYYSLMISTKLSLMQTTLYLQFPQLF